MSVYDGFISGLKGLVITGVIVGGIGGICGSCVYNHLINKSEIIAGDYNDNKKIDRYFMKNGKKIMVEIDGEIQPVYQDVNNDGITDTVYYGLKK